jgi:LemA protein
MDFKKILPWIIAIGLILIIAFWVIGIKNSALKYNQAVGKTWGDVEVAYQRRNDLIDNLVETVKGSAAFEKGTLVAVTEARANATSIKIDPTKVTPEQLEQYNKVQGGLGGALKSLIATVENYPQLKSTDAFLKLQDELPSTENQILTARTRFNDAVEIYNGYILSVPNNWFLSNYKEKPYFKSVEGANKAVKIKF